MTVPASALRFKKFLEGSFTGNSLSCRQVVNILFPILIDQAFIVCFSFLNTAMISSSGVNAVSAVSMVDSLNIFLVNVFVAVATGGTVIVAQYKGSANEEMVSKSAAGAMTGVFLLSVAVGGLVIVLHGPTLNLLFGNADPDVFVKARLYLIGSCLSYPGIAIFEAACGALRGVGETRSSLALSLIMNLSYVALNFLFIDCLNMSVFGMVLSLNIARLLGAFCSILYLVRLNTSLHFHFHDVVRVEPRLLKRVFFVGLPFAAEQMFFNGGKILTQTFVVQLGTLSMAANAISGSMAALFQIPGNAVSLGVVTIVGQCIGNRNVKDARKFIRSFLLLSSFSFVVTALVILPFFYPLVGLFSPPPEIIPVIYRIILVNALFQIPLWSVSFITPAALRAAGDAKFTSIISMLSMWLFRVVLGYILGIHTPLGVMGVWLAMDFEWGVRAVIFFLRYRGDKWYRHSLID